MKWGTLQLIPPMSTGPFGLCRLTKRMSPPFAKNGEEWGAPGFIALVPRSSSIFAADDQSQRLPWPANGDSAKANE